jgi:signal transduction histidine kinase/CheY-like chemotaxis protein
MSNMAPTRERAAIQTITAATGNVSLLRVSGDAESSARQAGQNESPTAAVDAADRASREWDRLSHLLAHELRAPLRCIDGFGQALLEDYGDKLAEEGREQLRYIREAAREMAELIDGLVTFSGLSRCAMHQAQVDLSELARRTLARLSAANPDRQVKTIVARDLLAVGDGDQLGLVIDHLLGNAWKFTSRCALARLQFGATAVNGEQVYFVRDNGAGFDKAYSAKLFEIFQRLHLPDEFPGVGCGLAIVHRIVTRHGGRIWADGEVDHGATFYFTLQSAQSLSKAPEAATSGTSHFNIAFVIDDNAADGQLVATTLADLGVNAEVFRTARDALAAIDRGHPPLIFLDVALMQSDAVDVTRGLGERQYRGVVQLMSGGSLPLLEAVQRIGTRHGVTLAPPLQKPFARDAIVALAVRTGLSTSTTGGA